MVDINRDLEGTDNAVSKSENYSLTVADKLFTIMDPPILLASNLVDNIRIYIKKQVLAGGWKNLNKADTGIDISVESMYRQMYGRENVLYISEHQLNDIRASFKIMKPYRNIRFDSHLRDIRISKFLNIIEKKDLDSIEHYFSKVNTKISRVTGTADNMIFYYYVSQILLKFLTENPQLAKRFSGYKNNNILNSYFSSL